MRLILLSTLLLAGCGSSDAGVQVQLPPLPSSLASKSENLPPNTNTSMGAQVLDNTSNIRAYNRVATDKNALIDLYNCVRDAVNNKKEIKCQ